MGAGVVVTLVAAVAALVLHRSDAAVADPPPPRASAVPVTPAAPAAPAAVTSVAASASCVRAGSFDGSGRPTSYEPARALDGDPTTAWRCDGDGVGQSLTVTFPAPVRIARVGLIPGLAKTDPADGTDRYAQNRRVAMARIGTDDGQAVTVQLETSPDDRAMQYVSLAAPANTRSLTVTILASVPGVPQNDRPAVESVAIAEIAWA